MLRRLIFAVESWGNIKLELRITELVPQIAIGVSLIPLLVGLFAFGKSDFGIRAIILLSLVSVCADVMSMIFTSQSAGNYIARIFSLLEFVLVSIFFVSVAKRNLFKRIIIALIFVFPLIVAADAFLSQSKNLRDDLVTVCESAIFLGYSIMVLYLQIMDMEYKSITSTPQFWILSAILVYFGGNIFVFGSSNYANSISYETFLLVWTIHAVLAIIYHITVSVGFWKTSKQYQ
jgi:ABC-type multidrug transport system permease subunit